MDVTPSTTLRIRAAPLALVLLCACAFPAEAQPFAFHHENILGTSLEIGVNVSTAPHAEEIEKQVLGSIERFRRIFSEYDPESEFCRWQSTHGQKVPLSEELFAGLQKAEHYQALTNGAVHPGVGALSRVWGDAEKAGRLPEPRALEEVLENMSRPLWKLDAVTRAAARLTDDSLSLNAFAKGLIIDRTGESVMTSASPPAGLQINIGGDLRVWGDAVTLVGITDPRNPAEGAALIATVRAQNFAVATSGSYRRGFTIGGHHFSHLLDPRTGKPAEHIASATVVARNAELADALATALCVLPAGEGLRLIAGTSGAECLLVAPDGRTASSEGWGRVTGGAPARGGGSVARDGDEKMLEIDFEINRPDAGGKSRRPYVAIWIENSNEDAVRTLVLWLQEERPGPRWHGDLRRWYMNEAARKRDGGRPLIGTVSGATRPPGKYQAVWDGRDDEGNPLAPGIYILYIEAAREHGTYQLMRQEITWGGNDFEIALDGNEEIKSVSLHSRRADPSGLTP